MAPTEPATTVAVAVAAALPDAGAATAGAAPDDAGVAVLAVVVVLPVVFAGAAGFVCSRDAAGFGRGFLRRFAGAARRLRAERPRRFFERVRA